MPDQCFPAEHPNYKTISTPETDEVDRRWPWRGHLCPAHQEQAALEKQLTEAWEIINVLTMMDIDRKEPWPRALHWLDVNKHHRKQNNETTKP